MYHAKFVCPYYRLGWLSQNIPLSGSFISSHDLMSSPSNIGIPIVIKLLKCLINLILKSFGTTITNNMKYSWPNSCILITSHLKDSLPKHVNVFLNFTWTELFAGLEADVVVLVMGEFQDLVDVLCIFADIYQLFSALNTLFCWYLLFIVFTFTHFFIIMSRPSF